MVGWRESNAAAVLIRRVGAKASGALIRVTDRRINRMGTGQVVWCEVRTGGGGGLVEIWWCRETFGCFCAPITSRGHCRGPVYICTFLFGPFAVTLTMRSSGTARGGQGAAGT